MAGELEVKGKAVVVTDKAIKIGNDWYSISYAKGDKIVNGDEVILTYKKKGAFKNVVTVKKVATEAKPEPIKEEPKPPKETPKYVCKVCGAALKDSTYDTCFKCKDKGSNITSDEKQIAITRQSALKSAAIAMTGNYPGTDPETLAEALIIIARRGLEFLQE
jgi:hypothetical protein